MVELLYGGIVMNIELSDLEWMNMLFQWFKIKSQARIPIKHHVIYNIDSHFEDDLDLGYHWQLIRLCSMIPMFWFMFLFKLFNQWRSMRCTWLYLEE